MSDNFKKYVESKDVHPEGDVLPEGGGDAVDDLKK